MPGACRAKTLWAQRPPGVHLIYSEGPAVLLDAEMNPRVADDRVQDRGARSDTLEGRRRDLIQHAADVLAEVVPILVGAQGFQLHLGQGVLPRLHLGDILAVGQALAALDGPLQLALELVADGGEPTLLSDEETVEGELGGCVAMEEGG